jgi:hypothetical protein
MQLKIVATAALAVGFACQVTNTPVSDPATATVPSAEPVAAVDDAAATEAGPSGVAPELRAAPRADGAACSEASQCASGVCEGEGCGPDQGRCAPKLATCTRDLVTYCGCDGKTFQASGSCARQRFAHRGACSDAGTK